MMKEEEIEEEEEEGEEEGRGRGRGDDEDDKIENIESFDLFFGSKGKLTTEISKVTPNRDPRDSSTSSNEVNKHVSNCRFGEEDKDGFTEVCSKRTKKN